MAVYQSLSVNQVSQNAEQNSSQVRILWQTTQTDSSYNQVQREAYYWISVNGEPETQYTVVYTLPKQSTQTLVDVTVTVPHNDNGAGNIQVRTWMDTHLSAGVVELRKNLTLDVIPRVTTLLATDARIGAFSRLALTKRNVNYRHSIFWRFGDLYGYVTPSGGIGQEEVRFAGEMVDFLIPESFYEAIIDRKSDVCTLLVTTYDGLIPIGDPWETTFTVTADEAVCSPIVHGSVIDIHDATLALTGDNRVFVRHSSLAQCVIEPYTRMGAQIRKKRICGTEVEGFLEIPEFDRQSVTFEVEDSRGYMASYTENVTLIPYIKLHCDAAVEREAPVSRNAVLYLSGDCYCGSFGAVDNFLELSYSIDGGAWIPVTPTMTEDGRFYASVFLPDMDYTRVYYIRVKARDALREEERQVILKKSIPVFDWGESDFAFHVPVSMDCPLPVSSGGTGGGDKETAWDNLGLTIPMAAGVEYPTWQRWKGQPVYTMLLELIPMPNNGCFKLRHSLAATQILSCRGCMSDGRSLPWGGSHNPRADIYCDTENLYVDTAGDFTALTAAVQILYVK